MLLALIISRFQLWGDALDPREGKRSIIVCASSQVHRVYNCIFWIAIPIMIEDVQIVMFGTPITITLILEHRC